MIAVPQYPPEAYQDGVLFFVRDGQVMPWAPPAIRAKFAAPPQDVPKPPKVKAKPGALRYLQPMPPAVRQAFTAARVKRNHVASDRRSERVIRACEMARSGATPSEIAEAIGVTVNLVYTYLSRSRVKAPRSNRLPVVLGERVERLVLLREAEPGKRAQRMFEALCDCGNTCKVQLSAWVARKRKSCGCIRSTCTEEQRARVVELRASGMSHRKIAEAVGMSKSNVAYILAPRKGANA